MRSRAVFLAFSWIARNSFFGSDLMPCFTRTILVQPRRSASGGCRGLASFPDRTWGDYKTTPERKSYQLGCKRRTRALTLPRSNEKLGSGEVGGAQAPVKRRPGFFLNFSKNYLVVKAQ